MISRDFRETALRKLDGKWGKAVYIMLAYLAFAFICGFIQGIFVEEGSDLDNLLDFIISVVEIPLTFGLAFSFLKLFNEETTNSFDFLTFGFKNFGRALVISFYIFLKMILPFLLILFSIILVSIGGISILGNEFLGEIYTSQVPSALGPFLTIIGFIFLIISIIGAACKSYYYQLSYYIAIDNPDMPCKEVVNNSEQLMEGKRGKLFTLQFSFIGWSMLAALTFGIGLLWLIPYINFSNIAFYKHLIGEDSTSNEVAVVEEEQQQ